jgi:hypothetical protein
MTEMTAAEVATAEMPAIEVAAEAPEVIEAGAKAADKAEGRINIWRIGVARRIGIGGRCRQAAIAGCEVVAGRAGVTVILCRRRLGEAERQRRGGDDGRRATLRERDWLRRMLASSVMAAGRRAAGALGSPMRASIKR